MASGSLLPPPGSLAHDRRLREDTLTPPSATFSTLMYVSPHWFLPSATLVPNIEKPGLALLSGPSGGT